MRPSPGPRGDAAVWDVVRPSRPGRMPDVRMAGFGDRGRAGSGRRAMAHPSVTLVLDFGAGPLVVVVVGDAVGRRRRGGLVAGFNLGAVCVGGEGFEAVQVCLSPLVARGVLGVPPGDLGGGVVALGDLWGRRVGAVREQLAGASSWQERFALVDGLLGCWRGTNRRRRIRR